MGALLRTAAAFFCREGTAGFLAGGLLAFVCLGGFGYVLLRWAAKLGKVSTHLTPSSLLLAAPSGRLIGGNGNLASASIPWSVIEALRTTTYPGTDGAPDHTICFLYSALGDFTLRSLHRERYDELISAILGRSGRPFDDPPPSRVAGQAVFTAGARFTFSVPRALGWAGLAASTAFFGFFVQTLWQRGLGWSDAATVPTLATMFGGSHARIRLRTR